MFFNNFCISDTMFDCGDFESLCRRRPGGYVGVSPPDWIFAIWALFRRVPRTISTWTFWCAGNTGSNKFHHEGHERIEGKRKVYAQASQNDSNSDQKIPKRHSRAPERANVWKSKMANLTPEEKYSLTRRSGDLVEMVDEVPRLN